MKKIIFLLLSLSQFVLAQNNWSISGKLSEASTGEPVFGATIMIKETAEGTISDIDGSFSLTKVPANATLVVQMIGYKKTEYKVSQNRQIFDIKMEKDAYVLEEFVSVGYGQMKKSDLTGAVSSVSADDLQKTPAAGLDQALQGKVAGVTVNANSGQPGQAAEVRIRGIGTINGASPIYVVDGMIVEDISFLSPNDIESTEVLKDASSTAIYGSRGANGVILVTTKKGEKGKTKVSVNSYVGVQNRWNSLDLMKSKEFAEMTMRLNPSASAIATYQEEGFNAWMYYKVGESPYFPMLKTTSNPYGMDYASVETNWQNEVFRKNAMIQDHYVSVTGGDDKSSFVMSASYFSQDGTVKGSDYNRLTLRINSSKQVNRWLKVGENLSFVNSKGTNAMHNNASPGASILSAAIAMAPWDPTHYPDGSINKAGENLSNQISAASNFKNVTNPFSMIEHNHPLNIVERWVGDIYLELTPFKNFQWRSALSMDLANNRNRSFSGAYEYSSFDKRDRNFLSSSIDHYRTLILENIANYNMEFGKHSFNLMAGTTTEQYNYYSIGGSGSDILNPIERNWYISQTTDRSESSDNVNRTRMFSVLSRIHYNYDSRYLLTLNFRADGTSKFQNNVWGYFPSTALAWRISEEEWMKSYSSLDHLKLRLGWGQIGNDKVGQDIFKTTVFQANNVFVGYPFGSPQELQYGAAVLTQANADGKWETTEQWSTGIDFGFRNGLIGGSIDGFIRDTKDMLMWVTTPAQVGNRHSPMANVGTVRNQGIELVLNHRGEQAGINYNVSGNVSFIDNELIALNGGSPGYGSHTVMDKGYALYTLWGYEYEGIYYSDQEAIEHLPNASGVGAGDAKYKDISGPDGIPDGKIDDDDKTDLGNPFPWLTYGLNISASYKGFDLQAFFQGVYGNELYNAMRHRTEGTGNDATVSTAMRDVYIDYNDDIKSSLDAKGIDWTQLVNTEGTIPNPQSSYNHQVSSRMVESGAYLRLKNIQLGYTLPKTLTSQIGINRCRFYLSGSNVFTMTNYSGYDPEVGGGIDYGNYPQARTFTLGVNLDF